MKSPAFQERAFPEHRAAEISAGCYFTVNVALASSGLCGIRAPKAADRWARIVSPWARSAAASPPLAAWSCPWICSKLFCYSTTGREPPAGFAAQGERLRLQEKKPPGKMPIEFGSCSHFVIYHLPLRDGTGDVRCLGTSQGRALRLHRFAIAWSRFSPTACDAAIEKKVPFERGTKSTMCAAERVRPEVFPTAVTRLSRSILASGAQPRCALLLRPAT